MRQLNYNFLGMLICLICLFSSCKKEVSGCTDTEAINYLSEANKEDGSCLYSGEISFWYDNQTRDSLLSNDIGAVIPYINDANLINVYPQFSLWSQEPDCKSNATRLNIDLGNHKSKLIKFSICYDNVTNSVIQDSLIVANQSCNLYKITW